MSSDQTSNVAMEVTADFPPLDRADGDQLLPQLVAHLREHRTRLRQDWSQRIQGSGLLHAMTPQEMAAETTSVYDNYVEERERIIRQQQDSIRELSTPVLPVRERLLILPIIGVLDSERARQLTEQLLSGIRTHRARVVVIDVTGAPDVDETVANHLVRTVDASRLMGASVIITGLSPKIAQTLVTIGVDLSKMNTIGDLQGGLEEAERLLGYATEQNGTAG